MRIQLGYTPDADDAYMTWALLRAKVDLGGWEFQPHEENIATLNDQAARGQLDATMISVAAYPFVKERYVLLEAGASFGQGAGPVVVAREPLAPEELHGKSIAIPGATTTAYAMLQLYWPTLRTRVLPFDKLIPAVETGLVDCALVIHEELLAYRKYGLHVVADLSRWWTERSGELPMPSTLCVVRKDLPPEQRKQIGGLVRESILCARSRHGEATDYAMDYAHTADRSTVETFISQYVNDLSVEMGEPGRAALEAFFKQTKRARILPAALPLVFSDEV